MNISCDKCKKKFDVDASLIADAGRMLECGSCKHRWFFKKDKSHDNVVEKTIMEKPIFNVDEAKIEELTNDSVNRKINKLNFLNLIPVFIISFIAIVIGTGEYDSPKRRMTQRVGGLYMCVCVYVCVCNYIYL